MKPAEDRGMRAFDKRRAVLSRERKVVHRAEELEGEVSWVVER